VSDTGQLLHYNLLFAGFDASTVCGLNSAAFSLRSYSYSIKMFYNTETWIICLQPDRQHRPMFSVLAYMLSLVCLSVHHTGESVKNC